MGARRRLNDATVVSIRLAYGDGARQADLARQYRVARSTVHRIVHDTIWQGSLRERLTQAEAERDAAYESRNHWCIQAGRAMQERDTLRATVQAQAEYLAALWTALEHLT